MNRWIVVASFAVALLGPGYMAGGVRHADAKANAPSRLYLELKGADHCSTAIHHERFVAGEERHDGDLEIEEIDREDPEAQRLKHYHRRGVGRARLGWMGEADRSEETLQLVKLEPLGSEAPAARTEALRL